MKRIYLIGFMGVGKSTIGKKLARELGFRFVDLDDLFEKKYKIRIDDFFGKYDEELFRKLEHEILTGTFSTDNAVVATGGGTPCFFGAMEKIKQHGTSIYLEMAASAIAHRLLHAKKKRPLIKDKTGGELSALIAQKLKERSPVYQQAHFTIEALSVDIGELAGLLRMK